MPLSLQIIIFVIGLIGDAAICLHYYGKTGASIKSRFFVYHSHNYGIATLMRVGFRFKGRQLLLHHFQPHQETEFHDHPWSFRTIVLWGGYTDTSWHWLYGGNAWPKELWPYVWDETVDELRMFSYRKRDAHHAHKTATKKHTWTIVLTGPKERDWCKGTPENWVCEGEVTDFDETKGMVKVDGR